MKNKLALILFISLSCTRHSDRGKQDTRLSVKDFMITQDSEIERLSKVSYVKEYTLIDQEFKMKFLLDSQRIHIDAYDSLNRLVWRTDPWLDNELMMYRLKRPRIIYFAFANEERTGNKEVIWIEYNTTQFGILDKETGKFTSFGQD
jgi:hypothetical protein